jgi:hypothetical protein
MAELNVFSRTYWCMRAQQASTLSGYLADELNKDGISSAPWTALNKCSLEALKKVHALATNATANFIHSVGQCILQVFSQKLQRFTTKMSFRFQNY